ncbi:hypothetical protein R1flu_028795 [Riccia fluitans]|uniref:Uncharacterized protein n=1 Tax=Riccia fluitans TaxID=41844 RepID=A0ABD1XMP1_9MARC
MLVNTYDSGVRDRMQVLPVHGLDARVSDFSGVVLEIVLTFLLIVVVYATAVDPQKGSIEILAPLAIGFTVLANHFIVVPFTGASMNPARSFGPTFATFNFHHHWAYWVGPLFGGGTAGLVYDKVFLGPDPSREHVPLYKNSALVNLVKIITSFSVDSRGPFFRAYSTSASALSLQPVSS